MLYGEKHIFPSGINEKSDALGIVPFAYFFYIHWRLMDKLIVCVLMVSNKLNVIQLRGIIVINTEVVWSMNPRI